MQFLSIGLDSDFKYLVKKHKLIFVILHKKIHSWSFFSFRSIFISFFLPLLYFYP